MSIMGDLMELAELFQKAQHAALAAYAPYSKFRVGAALLGADGRVYTGCNVENRSYSLTICAERSALVSAVSQGQRAFTALAISTPDSPDPVGPCGACRQMLSEFMGPDAAVIFCGSQGNPVTTTMGTLLPYDSLHELKDRAL